MTVCAVIWDLGGVLVRTEDWSHRNALAERFGMTARELGRIVFGHKGDFRAQQGELTADQQWELAAAYLNVPPAEIPALRDQFFAGDALDRDLIAHIYQLKSRCYSALLSNAMEDLRQYLTEVWQVDDAFHHMIISAEVGSTKTWLTAKLISLERIGVEPGEAVFIDDTPANITAAQEAGMHGIVFKSPQQTLKDLEDIRERLEDE